MLSGLLAFDVNPKGISPSEFYDSNTSIVYSDPDTGLGISEQLYTAKGAQGVAYSQAQADNVYIEPGNDESLFLLAVYGLDYGNRAYKERSLWTTDGKPSWYSGADDGGNMVMNIPRFTAMANCTIDDI